MITYRLATSDDIDGIYQLQSRYHVLSISEEDKKDGFVTTLFSHEQLQYKVDKLIVHYMIIS